MNTVQHILYLYTYTLNEYICTQMTTQGGTCSVVLCGPCTVFSTYMYRAGSYLNFLLMTGSIYVFQQTGLSFGTRLLHKLIALEAGY
jgi:hypothetical protein